MGCLFSSKKKQNELAESEGRGSSPNKEPKDNQHRPDLYAQPEHQGSRSPRPQLPSPYQNAVIDPAKKSQVSKYPPM